MAVSKAFCVTAVFILLAGCVPVQEGHWAGPTRNWRGVQATWDEATGWREWFPHRNRVAVERRAKACTLVETESRVVSQDGINDHVEYQNCYNTPYALATGQRLDGR